MVVKTKIADTSLVSRVRTTAGTRQDNSYKHSKNSKKTTRRATSAIWRIFAELDKPKGALLKMNLTSMQVSMYCLISYCAEAWHYRIFPDFLKNLVSKWWMVGVKT